jgi:hypothetical protein
VTRPSPPRVGCSETLGDGSPRGMIVRPRRVTAEAPQNPAYVDLAPYRPSRPVRFSLCGASVAERTKGPRVIRRDEPSELLRELSGESRAKGDLPVIAAPKEPHLLPLEPSR